MASSKKAGEKASNQSARRSAYTYLLPLVVIAAGIGAYYTSFDGVFMFDEIGRIVKNERIQQLHPLSEVLAGRRPVVNLSLALNYRVGGLDVWGFHAFNLAVHILAALTLFGVTRRTLARANERSDAGNRAAWLALSIALIWVVHPLLTQSVTYIIQRGESLMGLFYLLTLYCVIRGAESRLRVFWCTAAVIACALGMGSKAVMVTAPLVVLVYDRVFLAKSLREVFRQRWGLYLALAATWSLLAVAGIVRGVLSPTGGPATVGFRFTDITPVEYALTQPGVILHYLRLAFWPDALCLDYGWPIVRDVVAAAAPGILIVALLAATLWCLKRKPAVGFLGVWFFLILAPTSSIVPIKDPIFEHRMYLSLAALVALVVVGADRIMMYLQRRTALKTTSARLIRGFLVVGVTLALGYATAERNKDYHSRIAMWNDVIAKRPHHARAHCNLGVALLDEGRTAEAINACREAVRLDPGFASGHYRLAKALKADGEVSEAIEAFRKAVNIDPAFPEAHFDLGNTLFEKGMILDAITEYRAALAVRPRNADAHVNLGNALRRIGSVDEAIAEYREAKRINPDSVEARYNLGIALGALGDMDAAIAELRQLARDRLDYRQVHVSLGHALLSQGQYDAAIESYRQALYLNPRDADLHYKLGLVLHQLGSWDDAIAEYRATLILQPDHPTARKALDAIFKRQPPPLDE